MMVILINPTKKNLRASYIRVNAIKEHFPWMNLECAGRYLLNRCSAEHCGNLSEVNVFSSIFIATDTEAQGGLQTCSPSQN